jgi:predicted DNA-binding protein
MYCLLNAFLIICISDSIEGDNLSQELNEVMNNISEKSCKYSLYMIREIILRDFESKVR